MENDAYDDYQEGWTDWLLGLNKNVREVAQQFPPWELYLLKSSNHRVRIVSIDEPADGSPITISVAVLHRHNPNLSFERRVFGVPLEDLQMCNVPESV